MLHCECGLCVTGPACFILPIAPRFTVYFIHEDQRPFLAANGLISFRQCAEDRQGHGQPGGAGARLIQVTRKSHPPSSLQILSLGSNSILRWLNAIHFLSARDPAPE